MPESNSCPDCIDGYQGDKVCTTCLGQATLPIRGSEEYFKDQFADLVDKMDALDAKMDILDTHLDAIETKIDAL